MRTKQNYHLLTFHTTTAAMAMEDYCHEHGMRPEEYAQEKDRIEASGIKVERHVELML